MSKLSIKNMDLFYGEFQALHNVNLEIPKNQIRSEERRVGKECPV